MSITVESERFVRETWAERGGLCTVEQALALLNALPKGAPDEELEREARAREVIEERLCGYASAGPAALAIVRDDPAPSAGDRRKVVRGVLLACAGDRVKDPGARQDPKISYVGAAGHVVAALEALARLRALSGHAALSTAGARAPASEHDRVRYGVDAPLLSVLQGAAVAWALRQGAALEAARSRVVARAASLHTVVTEARARIEATVGEAALAGIALEKYPPHAEAQRALLQVKAQADQASREAATIESDRAAERAAAEKRRRVEERIAQEDRAAALGAPALVAPPGAIPTTPPDGATSRRVR